MQRYQTDLARPRTFQVNGGVVVVRDRGTALWGAWVIAKTNLPQLLERELAALARSGKLAAATIFI